MSDTENNKAFIREMIGAKKRLEDYPDRYDPDLIMHEPASLPFGGTYRGLAEFQQFYPVVRQFYDFSKFDLLGVFGDGNTVFATIRAHVAATDATIFLAEQFTFDGRKIVEVRLHACETKENVD